MADWILSAASNAEKLLNNLDQAAAETLAETGSRRSRASLGTSRRNDRDKERLWSQDTSTSESYTNSSTASPEVSSRSRDEDSGRKRKPESTRVLPKGSGATSTKKDITSDQLFDFLNETSKKKTVSSGAGAAKPSVTSSNGRVGGINSKERRTKKDVLDSSASLSVERVKNLLANRPEGTALGSIDSLDDPSVLKATCDQLDNENKLLRREISALSDEVSTFASRVRSTQETLSDTREALAEAERKATKSHNEKRNYIQQVQQLEADLEDKVKEVALLRTSKDGLEEQIEQIKSEKDQILTDMTSSNEVHEHSLTSIKAELEALKSAKETTHDSLEASKSEAERKLDDLKTSYNKLKEHLGISEDTVADKEAVILSQKKELEARTTEHNGLQQEFDDYKSRASRVLQMKERTIDDLRVAAGGTSGDVSSNAVETIELRRERDAHLEEIKDLSHSISQLRSDLQDAEKQRQEDIDIADSQIKDLENAVKDLQRAKSLVERDHAHEVQDLKLSTEELQRFKQSAMNESKRKESEISKLEVEVNRLKKSTSGTATSQLELKIRSLTDNVLGKQSQIEALTAEKQSLMLQLEHARQKPQDVAIDIPSRNRSRSNMRLDDDVGRVKPLSSIIGDSTSDSELGPGLRRMKKAAHALDKFSVQIGVFLRQYPAARLLVILYIILLHLWVLVVIMTYSPEMHVSQNHGPIHPDLHELPHHEE